MSSLFQWSSLPAVVIGCCLLGRTPLLALETNVALPFSSATELGRLAAPANGTQNSILTHLSNGGPGGTGALRFTPLDGIVLEGEEGPEHRILALYDADAAGPLTATALDSTAVNQWTTSLKVRAADLRDTPADTKGKAGVRLGFVGDAVVSNPDKPQESLNKPPQTSAIFADFKIEWENSSSSIKQPKLSVEVKSWNGSLESKPRSKFELTSTTGDPATNALQLDGWYQVTLTVTRTSLTATDYLITATVHDLGDSGTVVPVLAGTNGFIQSINNAPFSNDTTLHPFVLLEADKKAVIDDPSSSFEIDDYSFSTSAVPGPQPPPPPTLSPAPGGGAAGINAVIPFTTSADFDLFAYTNQNQTTIGYSSLNGTGSPASGAGVFQTTSATGVDKRVFANGTSTRLTATGPGTQQWTASIVVQAPTIGATPLASKYKAHTRFGFLASANIPDPTKPQDLWKQNVGMHADFKIEWENATGKLPTLSIEGKSSTGNGQESKTASKFESTTFNSAHWFQATLNIRRITNTTDPSKLHLLALEASVYDLGPQGTSEPILLGTTELGNTLEFANEAFSTAPALRGSFMLEGEKAYAGTPYYNYFVDDLTFQSALLPDPSSPVTPPVLTLALNGAGAPVLTWPTAPGWVLQSSPDLSNNSWTTHTTATSPHTAPSLTRYFFRLARP
ncbi:MAG: hypothetical protein JWL81_1817 [Verrucomicrobiales bacterium]|nr:hypothetical protein [Verrucomicrobiales bacterium]